MQAEEEVRRRREKETAREREREENRRRALTVEDVISIDCDDDEVEEGEIDERRFFYVGSKTVESRKRRSTRTQEDASQIADLFLFAFVEAVADTENEESTLEKKDVLEEGEVGEFSRSSPSFLERVGEADHSLFFSFALDQSITPSRRATLNRSLNPSFKHLPPSKEDSLSL